MNSPPPRSSPLCRQGRFRRAPCARPPVTCSPIPSAHGPCAHPALRVPLPRHAVRVEADGCSTQTKPLSRWRNRTVHPRTGPEQQSSAWRAGTNRRSSGSARGVQGAGCLPAATPTTNVARIPGDPYDRHGYRSWPREDRSPASNVHVGRGEGLPLLITTPDRARIREPTSCGRGGHPDTHDPPACR